MFINFCGILLYFILSGNTCVNLHADVIKQFDTMVFPEVQDRSNIVKRTAAYVWELISGAGSGSDHPKFTVPPSDDMRSMCMKIHLEPYKNRMLSGEFEEGFDVHRSVQDFNALYQCCLMQYCGRDIFPVNEWKIGRVQNVSNSYCTCTDIR